VPSWIFVRLRVSSSNVNHVTDEESLLSAIHEAVTIVPYDPAWPLLFETERARIAGLLPELRLEHIGSTAVPGMPAKPVIDCIATVPTMEAADRLVEQLCRHGYTTSAEFNRALGDRRWLMRHAGGRRTHHLHLVLEQSDRLAECVRFRDRLREHADLARRYAELKQQLADSVGPDREAYTAAKAGFIETVLGRGRRVVLPSDPFSPRRSAGGRAESPGESPGAK
jgi:GrpB-like predicted nucleotidyltransferase (UPF0157 family)